MKRKRMNLQLFAEGGAGSAGNGGANGSGDGGNGANGSSTAGSGQQEIDYEKLAGIVSGKQAAAEESVLRGYFKQQGLSKEEAESAIAAFKEQKKAQETSAQDQNAQLTTQLAEAKSEAAKAKLEASATLAAVQLSADIKQIPNILKLAEFDKAVDQDGSIKKEEVENAIKKVLEDVPAFKMAEQGSSGVKVGFNGSGSSGQTSEDALKKAFGL